MFVSENTPKKWKFMLPEGLNLDSTLYLQLAVGLSGIYMPTFKLIKKKQQSYDILSCSHT